MTTKEKYREYRREESKEALKAIGFFFVVLPLAFATAVMFLM